MDRVESLTTGKAFGKSIADRFLVRATSRFCAEEMSFLGPSCATVSHRNYSVFHRSFSFLDSPARKEDLKLAVIVKFDTHDDDSARKNLLLRNILIISVVYSQESHK